MLHHIISDVHVKETYLSSARHTPSRLLKKSIVVCVTARQVLSVLYRKTNAYIYSIDCVFFCFEFFFSSSLLIFFSSCSPCCASPCANRGKTMMIVDLIQNANRKSTIYLTSIIFSFFLPFSLSLSHRYFLFFFEKKISSI